MLVNFKIQKIPKGLYCKRLNQQKVVQMSHLQWHIKQLTTMCSKLYHDDCSDVFKYHRNVSLSKVSDESLLILLFLKAELGIKSQRHFYRICQLFPCGRLLERSRFNRRARQLIWLVQVIRQAMNTQLSPGTIVIIDSFPLPLWQPVRNHRTRIFNDLVDIGYNASKSLWF